MAVKKVVEGKQEANALVKVKELYEELGQLIGGVGDIPLFIEAPQKRLPPDASRHQDSMSPHFYEDRLIRLKEVLRYVPVGKTTWWEGVRSGHYPAPVHLGPRVTAWKLSSIMNLVNGEVAK